MFITKHKKKIKLLSRYYYKKFRFFGREYFLFRVQKDNQKKILITDLELAERLKNFTEHSILLINKAKNHSYKIELVKDFLFTYRPLSENMADPILLCDMKTHK